jgi:hypothetical protein
MSEGVQLLERSSTQRNEEMFPLETIIQFFSCVSENLNKLENHVVGTAKIYTPQPQLSVVHSVIFPRVNCALVQLTPVRNAQLFPQPDD